MRYTQVYAGEWQQPPRDYRVACCDCGLVHRMEFRVHKGHIQYRVFLMPRATAGKRRGKDIRWRRK